MDTPTIDFATGRRHNGGSDVEAAREASRQARTAVRQEVRTLIAEVENLLRCVRDAADPEVARARAEVESAVAATKKALAERAGKCGATPARRSRRAIVTCASSRGVRLASLRYPESSSGCCSDDEE